MKKQILILALLFSIAPSHSMQQSHPLNAVLVFDPSYKKIFLQGQKLTPENLKIWNDAVAKIKNFVAQNSNNDRNLLMACTMVEDASKEIISSLDYLRNVVPFLRTIKDNTQKREYARPIENQLNEILNIFYIAKDMTNQEFQNIRKENARRALQGTIRFMETAIMAELWQQLYNI